MRRGRACGGAVPVLLPRRGHTHHVEPLAGRSTRAVKAELRGVRSPASRPGMNAHRARRTILDLSRARRRRRRRAGRLDRAVRRARRASGAGDVRARRRAAHRRHQLLHRASASARFGRTGTCLRARPDAGRVDVVVSSELLETAAFSSVASCPRCTTLIISLSRVYTTVEKMQMGDGRFDGERIHNACRSMAKDYHQLDLEKLALDNRTVISATHVRRACRGRRLSVVARYLRGDDPRREAWRRGESQRLRSGVARRKGEAVVAAAVAQPALPASLPADFGALPAAVREVAAYGVARTIGFSGSRLCRPLSRTPAQACEGRRRA